MQDRYLINASRAISLQFKAKQLLALNPTGSPIYIRIGGNDVPTLTNYDLIIPPATYMSIPLPDVQTVGVFFAPAVLPSQLGNNATLTFLDYTGDTGIANVNLPQVIFNTRILSGSVTIAAGANTTIYAPPAGMNTALFQAWGSIDGTAPTILLVRKSVTVADWLLYWEYDRVEPTLTNIRNPVPPTSFSPNPLILGVGEGLNLVNGNGAQQLFTKLFFLIANF